MAAAPVHGGPPGNSWQYNPESQQYIKTWRPEYCVLLKGEDGQQRPVKWTCQGVEPVQDPEGYPAIREMWTWRLAEVVAPERNRSRSPRSASRKRR